MFGQRNANGAYASDIVLGKRYRESITGIEGTATSVYFYLNGCERVCLEFINKDGDLKELVFDAPRLVSLETGEAARTPRTGGPHDSTPVARR